MGIRYYFRLAFNNIKKDKNTFYPFLIAVVTLSGLFYMLCAIWKELGTGKFYGAWQMEIILQIGVVITGILCAGIVFYTNGFLMKRRTKELGLYNILGMEKKHIGYVLSLEISIIALTGLVLGMFFGILFAKLLYMVFMKMLGVKQLMEFHISLETIGITICLFGGVFLVDIFSNYIRLLFLKPVDMLQSASRGEKEPKTKWLMAILAVVFLGIGYYIAITTDNIVATMSNFMIAALLVILGTYCLFMALSVLILKMLKKNKNYYYHKTHFITVSDLMHRIRQNAVGLANICIFSTAVLVTLSTTLSLYLGTDDAVRTIYPRDMAITLALDAEEYQKKDVIEKKLQQYLQSYFRDSNMQMANEQTYYECDIIGAGKGDTVQITEKNVTMKNMTMLQVMTADVFAMRYHKKVSVPSGKVVLSVYSPAEFPKSSQIRIGNETWQIDHRDDTLAKATGEEMYCKTYLLLVNSMDEVRDIALGGENGSKSFRNAGMVYKYSFDLKGKMSGEEKRAFCTTLEKKFIKQKFTKDTSIEDIFNNRRDALGIYAGLFFIGIFVGILFLTATVLIIYYKQVSEGYEDRNNFLILQKVGLDKREVRKIINNQMKTIFFLPILVAVMHLMAAYPIVKKMLAMFNLTNAHLFVQCMIGTILVFVVFYAIIYRLTSTTYYRIVNK